MKNEGGIFWAGDMHKSSISFSSLSAFGREVTLAKSFVRCTSLTVPLKATICDKC